MKKPEKKQTTNAIYKLFKLTGRDAASESNEVRPESLQPFQPSYASSKAKYQQNLFFENDDFRLLFVRAAHFSTKNPINKPAKNNKTILIAAVFAFVGPVQKEG